MKKLTFEQWIAEVTPPGYTAEIHAIPRPNYKKLFVAHTSQAKCLPRLNPDCGPNLNQK